MKKVLYKQDFITEIYKIYNIMSACCTAPKKTTVQTTIYLSNDDSGVRLNLRAKASLPLTQNVG